MNKKRFLILTACMSVVALALFAQGGRDGITSSPKEKQFTFRFGLKAGANLSNITNGQAGISFSPGMKFDFHAGAVANFHFGHRNEGSPAGTGLFGLQPELLYSRQGFALDGASYSFDYITLPVMVKCYVVNGFYVEAGPYASYLLGVSPGAAVLDNAQIALSGLEGGLDAGAAAGFGLETKIGLTLGARYMLGLSGMANNLQWKNNVIAASVGLLF